MFGRLRNKIIDILDGPIEKNMVDKAIMQSFPTMEDEIDPSDITLQNAYKTRWIWYHTILAVLIFFTNIILLSIFLLLAIKL